MQGRNVMTIANDIEYPLVVIRLLLASNISNVIFAC